MNLEIQKSSRVKKIRKKFEKLQMHIEMIFLPSQKLILVGKIRTRGEFAHSPGQNLSIPNQGV